MVEPSTTRPSGGPLLDSVYEGLAREHAFEPLRVEGRLPDGLVGTFVRNGPAIHDTGTLRHWFDGRGALAAVRLSGGRAEGAVRVVHSPSVDHDRGRARPRYAGFAQPMSRAQRVRALFGAHSVRNNANINVLAWQERLFALHETALPVEIDPRTLDSLGETRLGGVIRGAWNAHPRRVPARRTTYQFGLRVGATCWLDVYALPDEGAPRRLTSLRMPGVVEVHDMFATARHLVFVVTPYYASALRVVLGSSFVECLRERPGAPTLLHVVPIDEPDRAVTIEAEPFFFWHGLNAFCEGDELVLDLVRYPNFEDQHRWMCATAEGKDAGEHGSRLYRARVDLAARTARFSPLAARRCEFPTVSDPARAKRHRHGFFAGFAREHEGRGWFDRLLRIDLEGGDVREIDPGPGVSVSEPLLVPRSERDDDVWLLSLMRDRARGASFLGIWDGATMESEPVARAWFRELVPPGLHGTWLPS